MGRTRRRTALIALLLSVPTLLLAALPALGWRMDDLPRPAVAQLAHKAPTHDHVFMTLVRISGTVQVPLSPGVKSPVAVTIRNSNPKAIVMQRVRVKIARITAPHADATHRCTRLDFEIGQMRRGTLRIPAKRVVDLAGLGIPVSGWPTLAMRNLPVNQDGCKGAQITLRFAAARLDGRA